MMKRTIAVIAGATVGTTFLADNFGRDIVISISSLIAALSYAVVAYSLMPVIAGERKSILAPGLLGIASFSALILFYRFGFVFLGRPPAMFAGWPLNIFVGLFGGLVASIILHLISLGEAQGKARLYLWLIAAILAFSCSVGLLMWHMGSLADGHYPTA